jgi:hypothetical protein
LEVAIATLYRHVGKLYTLSIGNLASSIDETCLTLVVRRVSDVVGALTLKRALLEPDLAPVFYIHLITVDADKAGPGRLAVGDEAEPVGDWLLSEAQRQLDHMLKPGRESCILTQSVGYKYDEHTFECMDGDESYKKGQRFWEARSKPLDNRSPWLALQLQFETGVENTCCFRVIPVTKRGCRQPKQGGAAQGSADRMDEDLDRMDEEPPSEQAAKQNVEEAEKELAACKKLFSQADAAHTKARNELDKSMPDAERRVKVKRLPFKRQELDAAIKARAEAERALRKAEEQHRLACTD